MSVSFNGFNKNTATFIAAEEITGGTPVKMSGNGEVSVCAAGEEFIGIAIDCDGKYVSVQLSGAVTATYTGATPECGFADLAAADGGVQSGSGREYLVLSVDEAQSKVTFLM